MLATSTSIIKDFITVDEQTELRAWALSQYPDLIVKTEHLVAADSTGWRRSEDVRLLEPLPLLGEIQGRIQETLGLGDLKLYRVKLIMHETGSNTDEHIDRNFRRRPAEGLNRANILLQAADSGGIFQIEGQPVDLPERGLLHYVGQTPHEVTRITKGSRMLIANFFGPRNTNDTA
jgi:hypothetical protein